MACGSNNPNDDSAETTSSTAETSGSASSSGSDGSSATSSSSGTSSSTSSGSSSTGGDDIPPVVQCGEQQCPSGEICVEAPNTCCGFSGCVDVTDCVENGSTIVQCACDLDDGSYDSMTGIATCEIASCDTTACNDGAGDDSGTQDSEAGAC